MDDNITSNKQPKNQASSLEAEIEPASARDAAHESPPNRETPSTGSPTKEDIQQPSIASSLQYKASSRISFAGEGRAKTEHGQNSERRHESRPFRGRPDSSSLVPELPSSPPNYLHNSVRDSIGGMEAPQAHLLSRGYGYSGFPSHQTISDPRSFALGQITAAARSKMAADSLELNTYSGEQIRPQLEEESTEEKKGRRKRKRGRGKQAERWDDMFNRLVEFKKLHGHCLVPNRYVRDPSLGAWVSTQRRHYKILTTGGTDETTPMTAERASRLASVGFAWATTDPRHVPWETRFQELLVYKEEHGTSLGLYMLWFETAVHLFLSLAFRKGDCVVPIGFKV